MNFNCNFSRPSVAELDIELHFDQPLLSPYSSFSDKLDSPLRTCCRLTQCHVLLKRNCLYVHFGVSIFVGPPNQTCVEIFHMLAVRRIQRRPRNRTRRLILEINLIIADHINAMKRCAIDHRILRSAPPRNSRYTDRLS